jgi:acyl CoA:acetate/3-ketoacid CoA transferase beta subunit
MEDHPMPKTKTAQTNHAEESQPRAKRGRGAKAAANKPAKQDKVVRNRQHRSDHAINKPSKQQLCLELLRRPDGASVEELQAATGWQVHSARGFLSGTVKKKLRLTLSSDRPSDGPRPYCVGSEA